MVVGRTQDGFDTLLERPTTHKLDDIMTETSDVAHPPRQEFEDRLTQRSGRLGRRTGGENSKIRTRSYLFARAV